MRVIEMNHKHPLFSMPLELLLMLAGAAEPLPMSAVADDLGFGSQQELRSLIRELAKNHDITVETKNGSQRLVGVEWGSAKLAREIAERYWRTVYGD